MKTKNIFGDKQFLLVYSFSAKLAKPSCIQYSDAMRCLLEGLAWCKSESTQLVCVLGIVLQGKRVLL